MCTAHQRHSCATIRYGVGSSARGHLVPPHTIIGVGPPGDVRTLNVCFASKCEHEPGTVVLQHWRGETISHCRDITALKAMGIGNRVPITGYRAKVRQLGSKRISDFRPRLHISFIILHQNTGDTSADCRVFEPSILLPWCGCT